MQIESFLKFYTAFVEDESQAQLAEEAAAAAAAVAEMAMTKPSIAITSTAPRIMENDQDANRFCRVKEL